MVIRSWVRATFYLVTSHCATVRSFAVSCTVYHLAPCSFDICSLFPCTCRTFCLHEEYRGGVNVIAAASADQHPEFKLPDGRPLADGYRYSEKAARQREIGLNLCMMSAIG